MGEQRFCGVTKEEEGARAEVIYVANLYFLAPCCSLAVCTACAVQASEVVRDDVL